MKKNLIKSKLFHKLSINSLQLDDDFGITLDSTINQNNFFSSSVNQMKNLIKSKLCNKLSIN
jgi:hypothetical protein